MPGRVSGKVALVTGAGRGQGRSHAVCLAREGADVIAVDICGEIDGLGYTLSTAEDLEETGRLVEKSGQQVVLKQVDIRDRAGLKAAVDDGVAQLGKLDVVVANAAIAYIATWDEHTPKMWQDLVDVNLTGTWNTLMATAGHVVEAGGGSIIVVSSAAGLKGSPFLSAYVATKHGVTGLARAFAMELAEHHVRVNSVHPTGVHTPMIGGTAASQAAFQPLLDAHPHLGAALVNMLPIDRMEPVDVSNAVVYLASDESRYVTSLAMSVDAGIVPF